MLQLAKQSKIDVQEEIRCLDQWLRDYEKYQRMIQEGTLYSEFGFDKLKDIAKQMYLSPIDYEEAFYQLKEKVDNAEMIKLNLKKVLQEYE